MAGTKDLVSLQQKLITNKYSFPYAAIIMSLLLHSKFLFQEEHLCLAHMADSNHFE